MDKETVSKLDLKKTFLYCFLLNGLLFFGLLTDGRLYIDDIGRSMSGNSDWSMAGRPLADVFLAVIQLGTPMVNLFPLPQIIALLIISLACVLLARSYSVGSPFFAAVCTLPLAGQPYFLENMSYSFDSTFMALALFLSIYGAILLSEKRRNSLVISTLLLLATLNLYQPAVGAFFAAYIFLMVKDVDTNNRPQKYFWGHLRRLGLSSFFAFLLYAPISRKLVVGEYARQHSVIVGLQNAFDKVSSNTVNYVDSIVGAWSGNITGFIFALIFVLALVISVAQIVRNINSQSALRVIVYAIICTILGVATIFASFFPQMFLVKPVIVPRIFVGFGAILSCCCLCVCSFMMNADFFRVGRYRQYFLAVPLCAVAYSLILFSYAYSRADRAQKEHEDIVISGLLSDTDQLITNNDITRFAIEGNIGWSPLVLNSARKYPLILSLVPIHINDGWYWGYMQLNFMGLSLDMANINQQEKLDLIKNNKPVVNKKRYAIYLIDDLLLIQFKKGD